MVKSSAIDWLYLSIDSILMSNSVIRIVGRMMILSTVVIFNVLVVWHLLEETSKVVAVHAKSPCPCE